MSTTGGPKLVTNGLQICLDWGNTKGYPGSGTTFKNLKRPSVNDGYLKNNATFSSSNVGYIETGGSNGSGNTNAVGDRIDVNTSAGGIDRFNKDQNWSIFFWLFNIGSGRVFSTGSAGAGTGDSDNCIWQMNINSNLWFAWDSTGGSANNLSASYTTSILGATWKMVGFTFASNVAGNNTVQLYVNGSTAGNASIATEIHSMVDRSNQTDIQWTFGGGYNGSCFTQNTQARFGPILLYNRTLTTAEAKQNYEAYRKRYGL